MVFDFNYPTINVEETFDEIVRGYGTAAVLRDRLPKHPAFPNADYVFFSEKIVAELKCLTEDNGDCPIKQGKLNQLLDHYYSQGKIAGKEFSEQSWKALPVQLQRRISDIYSTSIQARAKKANEQIRETKKNLKLDGFAGLLIIANDGLKTMPPAAFIDSCVRYVGNNLHNTDMFLFITANLFSIVETSPMPVLFWYPMSMKEPNLQPISEGFLTGLRKIWMTTLNRKLGITHSFDKQMQEEDMKAFWDARYMRRK